MGGSLKTYSSITELIDGFDNNIAARINGGQYYAGYDFSLSSDTTPVFNEKHGSGSKMIYTLHTGFNHLNSVA